MSLIKKIQPRRRKEVEATCNVIRAAAKLHGKQFTMADFGGANYHVKMLRESGLVSTTKRRDNSKALLIEFQCDAESVVGLVENYLETVYLARCYAAQLKVKNTRIMRMQGLAEETSDEPTEPSIERVGNCTIYRWSQEKHWQKQEGKRGYIPTCTTLGGNTVAHYG